MLTLLATLLLHWLLAYHKPVTSLVAHYQLPPPPPRQSLLSYSQTRETGQTAVCSSQPLRQRRTDSFSKQTESKSLWVRSLWHRLWPLFTNNIWESFGSLLFLNRSRMSKTDQDHDHVLLIQQNRKITVHEVAEYGRGEQCNQVVYNDW